MRQDTAEHYQAVATGKRSKVAGEFWEQMIDASCRYYSEEGIAEIAKTPEPMRPIKSLQNGRFVAVFTKMAQPDYKGTLYGGNSIVFEAKHTDTGRLQRKVISEEQERQLNRHMALGAECYVLISFDFERFFKVPWGVFRDMKELFGRKYITPADLTEYEIRYVGGTLKFL